MFSQLLQPLTRNEWRKCQEGSCDIAWTQVPVTFPSLQLADSYQLGSQWQHWLKGQSSKPNALWTADRFIGLTLGQWVDSLLVLLLITRGQVANQEIKGKDRQMTFDSIISSCCSTCTWVHTFIACGKIIWLVELVHLFLKAIPLMFLFHHGSQGGVHGVPRWAPIQTVMIFGEVAASCALRTSTVFDFHWLKPWCLDLLGGQDWLWSSEITWSARQQEII